MPPRETLITKACEDMDSNSGAEMKFRVESISGTATKSTVLCLMTESNGTLEGSVVLVLDILRSDTSTFIPRLRAIVAILFPRYSPH